MKQKRKNTFEKVVENIQRGKYRGRIMSADYSNLGVRLFNENKFARDIGVSRQELRDMGLFKKTDQCGWNLPTEPTVEELRSFKTKISEIKRSHLKQKRKRIQKQMRLF